MCEEKPSKTRLSKAGSESLIRTCNLLLRVLERWDELERFYVEEKKKQFPLKGKKKEVCWRSK